MPLRFFLKMMLNFFLKLFSKYVLKLFLFHFNDDLLFFEDWLYSYLIIFNSLIRNLFQFIFIVLLIDHLDKIYQVLNFLIMLQSIGIFYLSSYDVQVMYNLNQRALMIISLSNSHKIISKCIDFFIQVSVPLDVYDHLRYQFFDLFILY